MATVIQNFNTLYIRPYINVSRSQIIICFLKTLNMMRKYYERLYDMCEVKIQLFMQSRICTANFFNIDPLVYKLCCVE